MKIIGDKNLLKTHYRYEIRPIQRTILYLGAITHISFFENYSRHKEYMDIIKNFTADENDLFEEVIRHHSWKFLQNLSSRYYLHAHTRISFEEYIYALDYEQLLLTIFPFTPSLEKNKILASFGDKAIQSEIMHSFLGHDYYNDNLKFLYQSTEQEIRQLLQRHFEFAKHLYTCSESYKVINLSVQDIWDKDALDILEKYEGRNKELILIEQSEYHPYTLVAENEKYFFIFTPPLHHEYYAPTIELINQLKAISDPTKLEIIKLIQNEINTLSQLTKAMNNSKSTIHHHVQGLKEQNIVVQNEKTYIVNKHVIDNIQLNLYQFINK